MVREIAMPTLTNLGGCHHGVPLEVAHVLKTASIIGAHSSLIAHLSEPKKRTGRDRW